MRAHRAYRHRPQQDRDVHRLPTTASSTRCWRGTKRKTAVPAAPGILSNAVENIAVLDYGTPETLQWLRDNAEDLAAILVEPVQNRRPDFQPREFLRELRTLTEKSGTLLIFDEVVTGSAPPGRHPGTVRHRADLARTARWSAAASRSA